VVKRHLTIVHFRIHFFIVQEILALKAQITNLQMVILKFPGPSVFGPWGSSNYLYDTMTITPQSPPE
jgi:hypothetical protein